MSASISTICSPSRPLWLVDRFGAARDPELRLAQGNHHVAEAIAKELNRAAPEGAARDASHAREWIADQLDRGHVFGPGKVRGTDNGPVTVPQPIHEKMFLKRIRLQRPDWVRYRSRRFSLVRNIYIDFPRPDN